jgi:hypothetical protein
VLGSNDVPSVPAIVVPAYDAIVGARSMVVTGS